jgi:signal transduction histidine kinase
MRILLRDLRRYLPAAAATVASAPALYALSRANFLLFHSLAELFCVVVAFGTFTVAWNTRRTIENGYLLLLGLGMLFVGALDLVHTLAFRGMGVFPGQGANTATQLWVAARGLESLSLLVAPLLVDRRVRVGPVVCAYALLTAAILTAISSGGFPTCFVEGAGLTPFKKAAEYAIIAVLVVALRLLWRVRARFERDVFAALALALALTAAAEASFTLYRDVAGGSNALGHLLKLAAFVLIYRALVVTGIVRPLDLLFRTLKEHEASLQRENAVLASHQRELEAKNRELAMLSDRKNELLGIAAHDIRSPLTVIEMYTSLLEDRLGERLDQEGLKFTAIIRRTGRRILALVDDLLDYTAIESGIVSLERKPLRLGPLVEEALESHTALARTKGIEVRLDPGDDLPTVNADPLRVGQALGNLVSNALKFSPRGAIVTVRLHRRGSEAAISVSDEGPGIPAEEIPKIFAPFRRSTAKGTAGESSTGLGLAIVQKIAAAHGGRIEVESQPGSGSTFALLLPLDAGGEDCGRGERI